MQTLRAPIVVSRSLDTPIVGVNGFDTGETVPDKGTD